MPTLPRSQRIMALDKDDNVIFKSRRLKVEYGHIAVHHDVEVSYKPHPTDTTKAIKTVSGSFVIFTPDEFCEFCANPPEWFRGAVSYTHLVFGQRFLASSIDISRVISMKNGSRGEGGGSRSLKLHRVKDILYVCSSESAHISFILQ